MVHDEAGRVQRFDWGVPHLACVGDQICGHACRRFQAGDDLYHFHDRDRVKEVKSRHLPGAFEPGRDGSHR